MTFPGSRQPGWRLKPIGKYGLPTSVDIESAGLTLGRDPWNTCVISGDHWGMVSRVHARLELIEDRLFVRDLDSSNGTFVNDTKIESVELCSGDVLKLGPDGPRFLIFEAVGAVTTEIVADKALVKAAARSGLAGLGETAVLSLKRALGLEEVQAKASRFEERQKHQMLIAASGLCMLVSVGVVAFSHLKTAGKADVARVEKKSEARSQEIFLESQRRVGEVELKTAALQGANQELAASFERGLVMFGRDLERRIADSYVAREAWDEERIGLETQRLLLETRLAELSGANDASAEETELLAKRLDETLNNLSLYNPVEIEAEKLEELKHVRSAVVMIESRVVFREPVSRRLLHSSLDSRGESEVNLRDEGSVLDQRSSGSGFVISANGFILTNAHVALPSSFRDPLDVTEDSQVFPEVELEVVFSGTSKRIPAHLVQVDDDEDHDFALIQIEPFEGMPHLQIVDLELPPPVAGTEVFLCGFPLGTFAVQEGDRVIASTLKGILSRRVGPYVQIDAGVHPGISGGPVTDAHGKVIGVVCSVQATPKGEIAAAIGYALPIGSALRVLPAEAMR